jgi:hypothetical protein
MICADELAKLHPQTRRRLCRSFQKKRSMSARRCSRQRGWIKEHNECWKSDNRRRCVESRGEDRGGSAMRSGPDAPAQPPSPTCFSSADEEDLPAVAVPRACPPYVYCTQARNVEEIHIPEIILVAKRLWIGIKLRGAVARHNSFVDEDKNTQLTTHNRIGGQFPSTCVSVDSRNDRMHRKNVPLVH